ncbi:hypothetical protein JOQ06_029971, partial [Pogonophryne albipinna]
EGTGFYGRVGWRTLRRPPPSSPPSPSSLYGSDWSLGGSRDRNCVVLVTRPLRLEPAIKPRSLTQACQMGCQMRFG